MSSGSHAGAGRRSVTLTGSRKSLERIAVKTYLWIQRQRLPIPRAARRLGRKLAYSRINGLISPRTDAWQTQFTPGIQTRAVPSRPERLKAATLRPALRCMVATGTMNLGGQERVALCLARLLPSHGFDVWLAHAPSDEAVSDELDLSGVPFVKLTPDTVGQFLATHRPDVISVHGTPDWLVTAAAVRGIPVIETLHGGAYFFHRDTWPVERARSRHIAGFVAVSELVRRQYLSLNPAYPSERITTIPNGVDDRRFGERDRRQARVCLGLEDEFLFVSLARYHLQKNTFGLIAAFAEVARAHPEARLICAGEVADASYFEQVRDFRDALPCARQISLCGPCPDVASVLAAADGFALDSFYEGWPLASMEAIFTGLPAVLSEVGGAREQIGENARRGRLVDNPLGRPEALDWQDISRARFRPQANRGALVEAMCAIIAERERWQEMREELRNEAKELFSLERCAQRHARVLIGAAHGTVDLRQAANV